MRTHTARFVTRIALLEEGNAAGPLCLVRPFISGIWEEGYQLLLSRGEWAGPVSSYAYEWLYNGVPLEGATSRTFIPGPTHRDGELTGRVTATDARGSTSVTSSNRLQALDAITGNIEGTANLDRIITSSGYYIEVL